MIEPFLDCGINLDEILDKNPETHFRIAAQYGNLDIIEVLLSAGASASFYTRDVSYDRGYMSREIYRLGAVEELFERWWQIRMGSPQHLGYPESEYWILPRLISHPTFEGSNAVFVAMWALQHLFVLRSLLDAGWGRRDNTPPGS